SSIERGDLIPSLPTLRQLEALYKLSLSRMLDLLDLGTWLAEADNAPPSSCDEAKTRFAELRRAGRWLDALAVALQGESLADATAPAVVWRLHQATCKLYLGQAAAALELMQDCLEEPGLSPSLRSHLRLAHADALAHAGRHAAALVELRAAQAELPADADERLLRRCLAARVRITLFQCWKEVDGGDEATEVAPLFPLLRRLRELAEGDAERRLLYDLYEAQARHLDGNDLLAVKLLGDGIAEARERAASELELSARLQLIGLHRRNERLDQAAKVAARVPSLLLAHDFDPALRFEASYELYLLAREQGDESSSARHRRSCDRQHPLVSARLPSVIAFERLVAGGAA
ncbi:MAG: hypothetical protein AAF533_23480, partial [Acidobacteriota bacterium]